MRQVLIYAGLALIVAVALAVSLKERSTRSSDRGTTVISEFINLSAAPDERGMDFLSRERIQKANRAERLTHIQPEIIAAHARAQSETEATIRWQITDPSQTNAFDHTGAVFDSPRDLLTGQADTWNWAVVTERAESRATEGAELASCGLEVACRAWLLYWTASEWYYVPLGTDALWAALTATEPAFRGLPLEGLSK